jgi:hypothetical protein
LERPLPAHLVPEPVLSSSRITLENNGKIGPQQDGENLFARASGGGDATGIQRSPCRMLLESNMFRRADLGRRCGSRHDKKHPDDTIDDHGGECGDSHAARLVLGEAHEGRLGASGKAGRLRQFSIQELRIKYGGIEHPVQCETAKATRGREREVKAPTLSDTVGLEIGGHDQSH